MPDEGRGFLLHDPRRRPHDRSRRLVLPGSARGRAADQGFDRVLLEPHGSLAQEDEEVLVHPRDPYHRIDVLQTNRCVRVSLQGEVLAESNGALALFESNLPPRWYLPREDVLAELEPSETVTRCPYKGKAAYHSVKLPSDRVVSDLVWSYAEPFAEAARIKDRLCFLDEKVGLELDGEPQERPASPWQDGTGAREAQNAPPAQTRG